MSDINDLAEMVGEFRDERNWKQFHNPKDMAISLSLEASEFLEHFQWKNDDESTKLLKHKKTEVEDEQADVFYWVLLIAKDLDIDLPNALKAKLKKSAEKYPVDEAFGKHTKYTDL